MDYYVGLDVSLRSVAVCVIASDGQTIFERSVACEVADIAASLKGLPLSDLRIGFEADAMSQHLFFGLRAKGFDVVCMESRQVNAALSAMRNKTDKTDARGIAQVLNGSHFGMDGRYETALPASNRFVLTMAPEQPGHARRHGQ